MAAQLHISRMPVREALKRPGSEGSVESVANRDTRIAPIRAERVAQAILSATSRVEGHDDPDAAEVLLVSNVGESWPYGWNRSVI